MAETIFFSWQSDTPNNIGRSLVEKALEGAIGRLQADLAVEEPDRERDIKVDKDREGVPGSPPLVDTIFGKIDQATAVVVDVTFSGRRPKSGGIPNPNVLIEYGWALKSRGYNRVIAVMNTAYGDPADVELPFDMRHLAYPVAYDLRADATADAIAEVKKRLSGIFAAHLREILKLEPEKDEGSAVKPFVPQRSATTAGRFRLTDQTLGRNDVIPGIQVWDVSMPVGAVNWLRLMPAEDQGRTWTNEELQVAAMGQRGDRRFEILGNTNRRGSCFFRAADGYGSYPDGDDPRTTYNCSFIFRTGEIWGIDLLTPMMQPGWILLDRPMWTRTLENYRETLLSLGVCGPFKWIAGMEDTMNRTLAAEGLMQMVMRRQSVAPRVEKEGTLTETQAVGPALEPFYREVFDACHMSYSPVAGTASA
jgi:hypothetical protein